MHQKESRANIGEVLWTTMSALGAEVAGDGAIEGGGVELAERIVGGVGEIDDDEIETVGVRIDPGKGVGVDDVNARREEGFSIELGEHRVRGEKLGHFGIEIDERDAFDLGIFQDFADGEAVAAAEDQNAARCGNCREAGMNESFVIAVFVARAELQVAVEKEAQVVFEAGEDEMLVARVAGEDDFVGVDVVFGGGGDASGFGHADSEADRDDDAGDAQSCACRKLRGKQIRGPERDAGVDETEEHRGADQAETRHEENRKKQRCTERAEIIEGQNVGDDVAELVAVVHDAHEQRNFQADENAHHDDEGVENQLEALREGEGQHQERGRKSADYAEQKLDPDEAIDEAAIQIARESAADAHREEVGADDGGELEDAVAEEVAGQRAGDRARR